MKADRVNVAKGQVEALERIETLKEDPMRSTTVSAFVVLALFSVNAPASAQIITIDNPDQLVTLVPRNFNEPCPNNHDAVAFDFRLNPVNQTEAPFAIPPGETLVLTGVEWRGFVNTPEKLVAVNISIFVPSPDSVFGSTTYFETGAIVPGNTQMSHSAAIPNVRVNGPLCAQVDGTHFVTRVNGFLVKDHKD